MRFHIVEEIYKTQLKMIAVENHLKENSSKMSPAEIKVVLGKQSRREKHLVNVIANEKYRKPESKGVS